MTHGHAQAGRRGGVGGIDETSADAETEFEPEPREALARQVADCMEHAICLVCAAEVLDIEDQMTVLQVSEKIRCSKATVSKDLNHLHKNKFVDRVKIKNTFHYSSLRDTQQIVLGDEPMDEEAVMWT